MIFYLDDSELPHILTDYTKHFYLIIFKVLIRQKGRTVLSVCQYYLRSRKSYVTLSLTLLLIKEWISYCPSFHFLTIKEEIVLSLVSMEHLHNAKLATL